MPRYNHEIRADGEVRSDVPGWRVIYPAFCNGRLADLGFVASNGYGTCSFVHFDADGEPYGAPLTKAARARLKAMYRDFRFKG